MCASERLLPRNLVGGIDRLLPAELSPERSGLSTSDAHRHVEHARRAVDNNSFVPKKVPLICWSFSARFAHGNIELITMRRQMKIVPQRNRYQLQNRR
jgi:hypothetical protein